MRLQSSGTAAQATKSALYNNMIVLEATSDEDAKTLVHGMKWMVARMAFNLIVGNLNISCELLRPEQQQYELPETASAVSNGNGADEESMGPRRLPIRRTKVMNDITLHMIDRVLEKSNRYTQPKVGEPIPFK